MLYTPLNPPELPPATHSAVAPEITTAAIPGRRLWRRNGLRRRERTALKSISDLPLAPPAVCRTGRRRAVAAAEACAVTRAAAAPRRPARRRRPRPARSRRVAARPA